MPWKPGEGGGEVEGVQPARKVNRCTPLYCNDVFSQILNFDVQVNTLYVHAWVNTDTQKNQHLHKYRSIQSLTSMVSHKANLWLPWCKKIQHFLS